ncbi:protease-4 [Thiogranum longum]|uniref:Protease-4 n=1 Tax=Thiogranum longum TaxID=1537524 RepID=A0A4R1HAI4_9GAMM|nr:S49 family peptidase [Thiogranum longum]TCK18358.1 protease-4 [Thiogranum longum]
MTSNQNTDPTQEQTSEWQRDLIQKLATSSLAEQRRARRWGIFFKFLTFAYLVGIVYLYTPDLEMDAAEHKRHTALVELKGVIAPDKEAGADNVITGLRDAFENENTAGVILRINSPGGSPVQAGYINDEIKRLRSKYPDIPLYAVISDICASGGYYVAAAADKIYADKASIVGSIGVRMDGFGFVGAMEKLGVERRLITAGEHKGFLDPFQPAKASDIAHVKNLLADIHSQFINVVREGRGERLKETPDLFSGYVWTGEQSIDLGLVDELGSAGYVAREVIGAETIVDYTPQEDLLQKFSKKLGTAMGRGVGKVLTSESISLQ